MSVRTVLLSAVVGAALVAAGAGPAGAHPFGPPPTALLSARGHSVFVEWRAAPDDGIAVGVQVGLLDEALIGEYLEAPTQVAPAEADEDGLTASPQLHAYLLEHIVVEQDDRPCEGTVQPMSNFVRQGARLVYACPAEIDVVDVRITMLHDRHEAYRTFAVAEGDGTVPGEAVFTVAEPAQTFDFTGEAVPASETAAGGGVTWWPLAMVGGLGAITAVLLIRRGAG